MSESVDKILATIDVGLQTSTEHGYEPQAVAGVCVRCRNPELADDADICQPCRTFLLGDTDTDPRGITADDLFTPMNRTAITDEQLHALRARWEARTRVRRPQVVTFAAGVPGEYQVTLSWQGAYDANRLAAIARIVDACNERDVPIDWADVDRQIVALLPPHGPVDRPEDCSACRIWEQAQRSMSRRRASFRGITGA